MSKKGIVLVILIVLVLGSFFSLFVYLHWGRTLIIDDESILDHGIGEKYSNKAEYFLLVNKNDQTEVQVVWPKDIGLYDNNIYQITYVPAGSTLDFVIGYFRGWENIDGSSDVYIILDQGDMETKYRVTNDSQIPKSLTRTAFAVEEIWRMRDKSEPRKSFFVPIPPEIKFEQIKNEIRDGDVLVLFPKLIGEKETMKNDGIIVIDLVVLRRAFGIREFNFGLKL